MADYPIYLERREPARNLSRFYLLAVEVDLFGTVLAVRHWGRIGTRGRKLSLPCPSEDVAVVELRRLEHAKRRRGYA